MKSASKIMEVKKEINKLWKLTNSTRKEYSYLGEHLSASRSILLMVTPLKTDGVLHCMFASLLVTTNFVSVSHRFRYCKLQSQFHGLSCSSIDSLLGRLVKAPFSTLCNRFEERSSLLSRSNLCRSPYCWPGKHTRKIKILYPHSLGLLPTMKNRFEK